ncbi:MAG: FtsL-like putative cell division protein [Acidimicrobiia bacterium]
MSAVAVAPWPRAGASRSRIRVDQPRLRVASAVDARIRRRRLMVGVLAFAGVLAVLSMVAFHAMVAQSQVRLDELERRTQAAERRYEEARYEHARMSAPQRIVERATTLGLQTPEGPPVAVTVQGQPPAAPDATSTTLRGWSEVKPTLDDGS